MFIRNMLESVLGNEKAYEFALWAFGEGFEEIPQIELGERWNELHKDEFFIFPNGNVEKDLLKMIELWEKHTKDLS